MEEARNDESGQEKTPKWLRRLQLHSWEPEILLSGIVLYGMFQTPELLDKALVFLKLNFFGVGTDLENFIAILKVAIYWLTFGLILHLISRGIWVGMVGLSFTFPKGINYDNLNFNAKFSDHIDRIPSIQKIIISLEKLCSSLFAISFMLFMCMIGGYLYLFILLIIPFFAIIYLVFDGNFMAFNNLAGTAYIIIVLVIGVIALIDFLTLGFLKRVRWLSKIYWPIYRFIGFVTLSRFYRPVYYSIVSNFSKWKISAFLVVFVVISFYMVGNLANSTYPGDNISRINLWSNNQGTGAFNGYYDDQNEDNYSITAHIQSDIIRGNTMRLFVVSRADREERIMEYCGYDSLINELDTAQRFVDMYCLKKYYHIYIDDSLQTDLEWKFHFKSQTQQKGILTWINIRDLDEGLHALRIKPPDELTSRNLANIPFYREINDANYFREDPPAREVDDEQDYLQLKPLLPK